MSSQLPFLPLDRHHVRHFQRWNKDFKHHTVYTDQQRPMQYANTGGKNEHSRQVLQNILLQPQTQNSPARATEKLRQNSMNTNANPQQFPARDIQLCKERVQIGDFTLKDHNEDKTKTSPSVNKTGWQRQVEMQPNVQEFLWVKI